MNNKLEDVFIEVITNIKDILSNPNEGSNNAETKIEDLLVKSVDEYVNK